jgi:hypothetical protein
MSKYLVKRVRNGVTTYMEEPYRGVLKGDPWVWTPESGKACLFNTEKAARDAIDQCAQGPTYTIVPTELK